MKNGKKYSKNEPSVTIIVLNWNSWKDTIECLESLFQIDYNNYNIIVVDNHSKNDSINKIKEYAKGKIKVKSKFFRFNGDNKPISLIELTEQRTREIVNGENWDENETKILKLKPNEKLILIKNDDNYGFAKGNNIGMRFAMNTFSPDYFLLLNNDTAVEPSFLTRMVAAGDDNKQVGIIGPKIPYYDKPNKNWFCKGIINWFSINIAYHGEKCKGNNTSNDYITGCAPLIKKEVIEKIGYLNEKLFLYFEDVEYSVRAKEKSYDLLVEPGAVVYHKVSATSYSFILSKAQYYFSRNRIWFVKKYCPRKYLPISLMFLYLRLFLAVGFFALKRERKTVAAIFKAYSDGHNTSL